MRSLYIDIDCCRADHLSCNGYLRQTSPNIDRIAAEGVRFANCHTSNSPCLPSRAAMFSGRFGFHNGVVSHHGTGERMRPNSVSHRPDPEKPFFIHHLWRSGMKTVAFSSFHDRHNAWWWSAGWDEIHTNRYGGGEIADVIAEPALAWLEQNAESDNWLVDVHFWDPHSHYRVPDEWRRKFWDEPGPDFPDEAAVERNLDIFGPRSARDLYTGYRNDTRPDESHPEGVYTVADAKRLIDMYDGSIAYVDHHVGRILDLLARKGVLDDTAVIVSADHGDSFGEHGQYMDHGIANEAVHHIPMVVRWPDVTTQPGRCGAMVYGMDLGPTLCELLDLPTPSRWDGRSFAPALRGQAFDGWPYQVWDHGIYTLTRAVRTPDWLMIRVLHPGLYPYDDPIMLHDMRSDPHQAVNLAAERPDKVGELTALMEIWREEQINKGGGADPMEQMVPVGPFLYYTPEQMFERLERTGRANIVPQLKARLNRYHPGRYP